MDFDKIPLQECTFCGELPKWNGLNYVCTADCEALELKFIEEENRYKKVINWNYNQGDLDARLQEAATSESKSVDEIKKELGVKIEADKQAAAADDEVIV